MVSILYYFNVYDWSGEPDPVPVPVRLKRLSLGPCDGSAISRLDTPGATLLLCYGSTYNTNSLFGSTVNSICFSVYVRFMHGFGPVKIGISYVHRDRLSNYCFPWIYRIRTS